MMLADNAGKKTIAEISAETGLSPGYLRCTAQHYEISMAMPPTFSDNDKHLMRCLRQEGLGLQEIADKFECSLKTVFRVCKGVQKGRKAA